MSCVFDRVPYPEPTRLLGPHPGAFYIGRSWAQRGNVARFNQFDTVRPTEILAQKSCTQNAFYLVCACAPTAIDVPRPRSVP